MSSSLFNLPVPTLPCAGTEPNARHTLEMEAIFRRSACSNALWSAPSSTAPAKSTKVRDGEVKANPLFVCRSTRGNPADW